VCQYGNPACVDESDDTHVCRTEPARSAPVYHHPTIAEMEAAVTRAEESLRAECRAYLAARTAVQDAQREAMEASCRWGRAFRELASAKKAVARERQSLAMLARILGRTEAKA